MNATIPAPARKGVLGSGRWVLLVGLVAWGVVLHYGGLVAGRQRELGRSLEAYGRISLVAQQLMEYRRALGRFPPETEIDAHRASLADLRELRLSVREEPRTDGPAALTVIVAWRVPGYPRRQMVLMSLAPSP